MQGVEQGDEPTPADDANPAEAALDPYPATDDGFYRGRLRHGGYLDYEHSAYVLLIDERGRQRVGFPFEQATTAPPAARHPAAAGRALIVAARPGAGPPHEEAAYALGIPLGTVIAPHRPRAPRGGSRAIRGDRDRAAGAA